MILITIFVKTFQGYANKIEKDLKGFLISMNLSLEKIKVCQSEENGAINLTLIYEQ